MAKSQGFNRDMLLLATQLANEADMKTLLLKILEELLNSFNLYDSDNNMEALTLIRCIIRLVVKLMAEPGSKSATLVPTLLGHFSTVTKLIQSLHEQKRSTAIMKDVSWLWRTAYNCAIQGCSEWEDLEEDVSRLFDTSRMLLEIYCEAILTDVDPEIFVHLTNCSFTAVAGRMFALRRLLATEGTPQSTQISIIKNGVKESMARIRSIIEKNQLPGQDEILRAQSLLHILRIFEVEILCLTKEWRELLLSIEETTHLKTPSVDTFEAIADLVWVEKECPNEVLFASLEAILHASLDRRSLSVKKFSRWLRAICTILLSRNTPLDRAKAAGYVEQAVAVLAEYNEPQEDDDGYPVDERQWLLGTAYNTGIACMHASQADEAKRWFESSLRICRFIPDGSSREEKINRTYRELLKHCTPKSVVPVEAALGSTD